MTFEIESDWKTSTDKQALVRYASVLGVKTDGRAGIETIRKQIAETLGEPEVRVLEPRVQITETQEHSGSYRYATMKAKIAKQKKYVAIISSTNADPHPAVAGNNGVMFVVPRDTEVVLPEGVIRTFQKAIQTHYRWDATQNRNVPSKVPLYPLSVLREATEDDLKNEALRPKSSPPKQLAG